jgi:hypothetical protein
MCVVKGRDRCWHGPAPAASPAAHKCLGLTAPVEQRHIHRVRMSLVQRTRQSMLDKYERWFHTHNHIQLPINIYALHNLCKGRSHFCMSRLQDFFWVVMHGHRSVTPSISIDTSHFLIQAPTCFSSCITAGPANAPTPPAACLLASPLLAPCCRAAVVAAAVGDSSTHSPADPICRSSSMSDDSRPMQCATRGAAAGEEAGGLDSMRIMLDSTA